jgi:SAM-dependent methyltransferase
MWFGLAKTMASFFDSAYRETPPWDVGVPQPAMLALLDEFPPAGPALDVGCGTGELALALARRGLSVLGVDLAAAAIEKARAKAEAAGLAGRASFVVGDALHPARLPGPFGSVVDTGFFHLFGPAEREAFAQELTGALAAGGRFYLLGFAMPSPYPNAPRRARCGRTSCGHCSRPNSDPAWLDHGGCWRCGRRSMPLARPSARCRQRRAVSSGRAGTERYEPKERKGGASSAAALGAAV